MQLLKYLQAQGLGSRKQCQWLIDNACVVLNGQIQQQPKAVIDPAAITDMRIDGHPFMVVPQPYFYILLNKPAAYESSHKPQHYPSVFSLFPEPMRRIPMKAVGRLDADTTGVLLITNDGQFNHRMTAPKHKIAKRYQVGLKHPADEHMCRQLLNGVHLHDDNETVHAAATELADTHTLLLTITQGKYHQVKRMVAATGNRVESLHRLQFDRWGCADLAPGQWRFINVDAAL